MGLVGGHQVFEFFKPVEDDVDLGWVIVLLNHHETLSVRREVVVLQSCGILSTAI